MLPEQVWESRVQAGAAIIRGHAPAQPSPPGAEPSAVGPSAERELRELLQECVPILEDRDDRERARAKNEHDFARVCTSLIARIKTALAPSPSPVTTPGATEQAVEKCAEELMKCQWKVFSLHGQQVDAIRSILRRHLTPASGTAKDKFSEARQEHAALSALVAAERNPSTRPLGPNEQLAVCPGTASGAKPGDGEPAIDTHCKACGGQGALPVTEDDGDRSYQTGTQCLECNGTGENPKWREDAAATPRSSAGDGAMLIAAERERQVSKEGWTADHDDYEHAASELTEAAMSYAEAAAKQLNMGKRAVVDDTPDSWPWDAKWWKPSADPVRNLVKAGALIAAEIDRRQRAAMQTRTEPGATGEREGN